MATRQAFEHFPDRLHPPMCVGMETGPGAQAWGRRLQARWTAVKILPAHGVKAHGHRMKNDLNDARAILRAMHDRDIGPVRGLCEPADRREQSVARDAAGIRSDSRTWRGAPGLP